MKWIKCSDQLPEEGRKVLTFDGYEIKLDYVVIIDDAIWACRREREQERVIAWIEIPNPPEINKNENYKK
jgi:hypothetical protein|uniref:DUF551 domain-containing protein n=1 Tax=uncultured Caudovirales phage TaxID=2100421 RepID=A0A6J5KYV7_9CAUD|nr:Domain of unknown function DUF551 [uncultured Caudovirales phage]